MALLGIDHVFELADECCDALQLVHEPTSDVLGPISQGCLDPVATLAGEQVTNQHRPAELLPACGLLPASMGLRLVAVG